MSLLPDNNVGNANIVELLNRHTDPRGRFVCPKCTCTDTFIYRISELQEGPEEKWERWIKGVIQIDSGVTTYSPYVLYLWAGGKSCT